MSTKIELGRNDYTRAEICTTADCNEPRIRTNALKCATHEIVYRAAAKIRANERKIAREREIAAAAKIATPRRNRKSQTTKIANVDANGLRTTRAPRPA